MRYGSSPTHQYLILYLVFWCFLRLSKRCPIENLDEFNRFISRSSLIFQNSPLSVFIFRSRHQENVPTRTFFFELVHTNAGLKLLIYAFNSLNNFIHPFFITWIDDKLRHHPNRKIFTCINHNLR